MTKNRIPNKTEKLAAVLLMLKRGDGWLIPEPVRSKGSAKEICAAVEFHHTTPFALVGVTRPQALTPLRREDHAEITRKQTVPMVAKVKRSLKKKAGQTKRKKKMPSRPFPSSAARKAWKEQRGLA